jgi:hypothetical protein
VDVAGLNLMSRPRFDLSEFWTNAGVAPDLDDESRLSATVRAMESARTPDELMEMLEGGMEPLPEADGSGATDGRGRWIALLLAGLLALGAIGYAFGPSLGEGAPSAEQVRPAGQAIPPAPNP